MGKEATYVVRFTDEERQTLQPLVAGPRVARDKALRARMLLKTDVDGPGWSAGQIAEAFEVGISTLPRLRQRVVEERLDLRANWFEGGFASGAFVITGIARDRDFQAGDGDFGLAEQHRKTSALIVGFE